jgi:cellulose synthase/poly-beta-1,6-N-acetylglucosamine synthase-like glycosyltransferase
MLLTWLAAKTAFWSAAGVIGYTYVGYPAGLMALARLRPRPPRRGPGTPTVSVVLAAHDEEQVIARKLDDLLALDYPKDKLEVIVVSDGSTDRTADIVRTYADRAVTLVELPVPAGKPLALNHGVGRARGEVLLFCDARQRIEPEALRALCAWFADPEVGAVSGELQLPVDRGPGLYWRYEKAIRQAEGAVGSVPGCTGALFAIRRALWRDLPAGCLLDDVYTPMQIALQGYRVGFEPAARVVDEETDLKGEFNRKARTLAGNFQLIEQLPGLLDPARNPVFFQYVSHKLLRLACPYALATLFGSNVVLVATFAPGWPFYAATLAGQVGVYALAALQALTGRGGRVGRVSETFVVLNLAAVVGLVRYLKGDLAWTSARATITPLTPGGPAEVPAVAARGA